MPTKNQISPRPGTRAGSPSQAADVEEHASDGRQRPETSAGIPKERRREPRWAASGEVWLWPEGSEGLEIRGRLVDLSAHGFRVAHTCRTLKTGARVRFRHAGGQGVACVVWNRIVVEGVESGFLLL